MIYKKNAPVRFQTSDYVRYDEGICFDRNEFMSVWGQPVQIGDITSYQIGFDTTSSELLTNPNFDSDTAWDKSTGDWTISGGSATYAFSSGGVLSQGVAIRAGLMFLAGFQISAISGFTGGEEMDVSIGGTTVYTITSTDVVGAIFFYAYVADMTNNEMQFTSTDDVSISITSTLLRITDTPNIAIKDQLGFYTRTNSATITSGTDTTATLPALKTTAQIDFTWPSVDLGTYQISSFDTSVDANLGDEKVVEPLFSTSNGWILGSNWAISLSTATFSGPGGGGDSTMSTDQSLVLVAHATYLVQVTFLTAPTGTGNVVIDLEGITDTIDVTTISALQEFSYLTTIAALASSDFSIKVDNTVTNLEVKFASVMAIIGDDADEDLSTEPYQLETTWVCSQLLAWTDAKNALDHNFEQFSFTHKMRVIGKFENPTYVEDENKQLFDSNSRWQSTYVSSYKEVPFKLFLGAPILGAPDYIYAALNNGFHHGNFAIDGVNHQKLADNLELSKPDPLMKLYTAEVRLQETSTSGATINPDGTLATSGLTSAYISFSDSASGTSTASGSDNFKFRSANNLLSLAVENNNVTHGDNLLLTVNAANLATLYLANGALTSARTITTGGNTLTLLDNSATTTPYFVIKQDGAGDPGIRWDVDSVWFQWYIDNSDGNKFKLQDNDLGVWMEFDAVSGMTTINTETTIGDAVILLSDLTIALTARLRIPASAAIAQVDALGIMAIQTTKADWTGGTLSFHDGTVVRRVLAITDLESTSPTNGDIFQYDGATDEIVMVPLSSLSINTIYATDATFSSTRVATLSSTDQLTLRNSDTRASAMFVIDQTSTGDAGIEFKIVGQSYYIGIDNSADDVLVIGRGAAIGTTPDVFLDSSGQFGIGKAPNTILHAFDNSTSATPIIQIEQDGTGDAGIEFNVTAQSYYMGIDNSDSDKLKIGGGNLIGTTPFMTIDNAGMVGVGTDAPDGSLHISRSSGNAQLKLQRTGSSTGEAWIFVNSDNLNFASDSGGSPSTSRLVIELDTGDIGISTSSPDEKLHVVGNLKVEGQAYEAIQATLTPSGTTQTIDWDDGNYAVLDLGSASGNVTVTLSNPNAGAFYFIEVIQGATARTITWPAAVTWPGGTAITLSTGNNEVDTISMGYNGTNYRATFANNFS